MKQHLNLLKNTNKLGILVVFGAFCFFLQTSLAFSQQAQFGINLSNGKEPIELNADNLEMHDKDGIAIFTGNVKVVQGERILRTSKLVVHYNQSPSNPSNQAFNGNAGGLGSTGIAKMEATGKVYVKSDTQIATGDTGLFDADTNLMILTGKNVILTDGNNVATGCKLTANMDTGKALLESCANSGNKGRVSIILDQAE